APRQLGHQAAARGSSGLVEAVDDQVQNSVQSDLLHRRDLAGIQILSKQHAKRRRLQRIWGAGVGQVHTRVERVRAQKQAVAPAGAPTVEDKGVRRRLINFV